MTQVSHMTLDDLKTGMIVTMRNGSQFTVIRNMAKPWRGSNDILVYGTSRGCRGWMPFTGYSNNMRYNCGDREWDIVKVEVPSHPFGFMHTDYESHLRTLIWAETPAVKLTLGEIEERLGYRVEIISKED